MSCDQDGFVQECKVTCENVTCNTIVVHKTFDCGFKYSHSTYITTITLHALLKLKEYINKHI